MQADASVAVFSSFLLWFLLQYVLDTIVIAKCVRLFGVRAVYTFLALTLAWAFFICKSYRSDIYIILIALSLSFHVFDCTQVKQRFQLHHHIATALALAYMLVYGDKGGLDGKIVVFMIGSSIFTEPILMCKRVLKANDLYSGTSKQAVSWVYAISFGGIRLALWSVMIIKYLFSVSGVIIQMFLTLIYYKGVVFSLRIFEMAYKDIF